MLSVLALTLASLAAGAAVAAATIFVVEIITISRRLGAVKDPRSERAAIAKAEPVSPHPAAYTPGDSGRGEGKAPEISTTEAAR